MINQKKLNDMNCFASKKGTCTLLRIEGTPDIANNKNCASCPFFKTREQYVKDRLAFLDKEIMFLDLDEKQANRLYSRLSEFLKGVEPNAKE